MANILKRKLKRGADVFRSEGVLGFGILTLQFLQKQRAQNTTVPRYKQKLSLIVKYKDLVETDASKGFLSKPTRGKQITVNWLMPPPGKGSGGHINIFRFIKFAEEAGHTCRIYLYADGGSAPMEAILEQMGESYPKTKAASHMRWLNDTNDMEPADALFATSWETAYPIFNNSQPAKRFYFVQDFEPYFFSIGSLYSLAENTYKFGFYGVTAGGWLAKKLNTEYGMSTDSFNFGADKETYALSNYESRKEIFFYARPYTARRGFEMGIVALDLFHKEHPEYTINLVGWDVSDYEIPFPYVNLKTLEVSELSELYNRCAAGLVISLTNMSLLPLEMLACGTIPVVNDGENNRLVSDNEFIAYAPNDPVSLANELSRTVERRDLLEYAKAASDSVDSDSWQTAGKAFVSILEREVRKP